MSSPQPPLLENQPQGPPPNPNYKYQFGELCLPNGDIYKGDFCLHISGLIWREGTGKYLSQDGHCYLGQWKDDKLNDNTPLKISYPNEDEYRGMIIKGKYNGPGAYTVDKAMDIVCEFADNKPKGNIILVDVNGVVWSGPAGKDKAILLPENLFYARIREDFGLGYSAERQSTFVSEQNQTEEEEKRKLTDSELERIIFAKSTKTPQDLQLEDSIWYQRFLKFLNHRKIINKKFKQGGSQTLDSQELKWYGKYMEFKKNKENRLNQMHAKEVDDKEAFALFEKFKAQKAEPPLRIFIPRDNTRGSIYSDDEATKKRISYQIE